VSSLLNLHYLDLSGNYIEVIPRNLNELRELDTVKFNSNLITKVVALTKVRVYQVLETLFSTSKLPVQKPKWSSLDWTGLPIWILRARASTKKEFLPTGKKD
jgi:hypothetical protein